jgi:hypothetical protein
MICPTCGKKTFFDPAKCSRCGFDFPNEIFPRTLAVIMPIPASSPIVAEEQTVHTPPPPPGKVSFFSIPGDPNIPALVRAYGTIIRVVNAMMIILCVIAFFALMQLGNTFAFGCLLQIAINIILFFVGGLLRDGRRSGVKGLTVLAVFDILAGLLFAAAAKEGGLIIACFVFIGVSVLLGPPIVVAYKNWEKFH